MLWIFSPHLSNLESHQSWVVSRYLSLSLHSISRSMHNLRLPSFFLINTTTPTQGLLDFLIAPFQNFFQMFPDLLILARRNLPICLFEWGIMLCHTTELFPSLGHQMQTSDQIQLLSLWPLLILIPIFQTVCLHQFPFLDFLH